MRPDIKDSLDRYVNEGCPTGGFLQAVLENDMMEAAGRADDDNRYALFEICGYIYNSLPSACHGSPEKVDAWLERFAKEREAKRLAIKQAEATCQG